MKNVLNEDRKFVCPGFSPNVKLRGSRSVLGYGSWKLLNLHLGPQHCHHPKISAWLCSQIVECARILLLYLNFWIFCYLMEIAHNKCVMFLSFSLRCYLASSNFSTGNLRDKNLKFGQKPEVKLTKTLSKLFWGICWLFWYRIHKIHGSGSWIRPSV